MKDLSWFSDLAYTIKMSSMKRRQLLDLFLMRGEMYLSSNSDMNMFAYVGAHIVPMAQPLI